MTTLVLIKFQNKVD